MSKEIVIAIIAFFAAVLSAFISANVATKNAIVEERQRMSGGTINTNGTIAARVGRTFTPIKEGVGVMKIVFDTPFSRTPIALVAPHREAASSVGIVRIMSVDERSLVVTTRHYDDNATIAAPFSFMVLESMDPSGAR